MTKEQVLGLTYVGGVLQWCTVVRILVWSFHFLRKWTLVGKNAKRKVKKYKRGIINILVCFQRPQKTHSANEVVCGSDSTVNYIQMHLTKPENNNLY